MIENILDDFYEILPKMPRGVKFRADFEVKVKNQSFVSAYLFMEHEDDLYIKARYRKPINIFKDSKQIRQRVNVLHQWRKFRPDVVIDYFCNDIWHTYQIWWNSSDDPDDKAIVWHIEPCQRGESNAGWNLELDDALTEWYRHCKISLYLNNSFKSLSD